MTPADVRQAIQVAEAAASIDQGQRLATVAVAKALLLLAERHDRNGRSLRYSPYERCTERT